MKKALILWMAGLILAAAFVLAGCASTPSYATLPEASPDARAFVGSWVSNDAMVSESWGSLLSVKGRQFYVFNDDGTGEILDYNGNVRTNRRAFRYRVSDTLIGFQFLKGTVFTNGGSFSRPYTISADKRRITFPDAEYGIGSFVAFTLNTTAPPPPPPPPPPPAEPEPKYDNAGKVYYDYNGTGYVHLDNSVFYLCSSGKPVGYVERAVIYAFNGKVLGFLEGAYIHDREGKPIGTTYEASLGNEPQSKKKPVAKVAPKQALPEKGPKEAVNKPLKLRDGYYSGVLSDIFGR